MVISLNHLGTTQPESASIGALNLDARAVAIADACPGLPIAHLHPAMLYGSLLS